MIRIGGERLALGDLRRIATDAPPLELAPEARAAIAAGDIGRPHFVHGHYLQDWLLKDTDYSWRLEPDKFRDAAGATHDRQIGIIERLDQHHFVARFDQPE